MMHPTPKARDHIQSLLIRIIEHEIKMSMAAGIDAQFGTTLQASRPYWQKETGQFWRRIDKSNRPPSRRCERYFSKDEIDQWKSQLLERGVRKAVNRLMKDLNRLGVQGDARWLNQMVEALYDRDRSDPPND